MLSLFAGRFQAIPADSGTSVTRVPKPTLVDQRYISRELTHCVGRSLADEDSQYRLLMKIVGGGYLSPHPDLRATGMRMVSIGESRSRVSTNEMYRPDMVCFCDIPVADLALHMQKYSRFGLSFLKGFVAEQGGAPVRYVPAETQVSQTTPRRQRLRDEKLRTAIATLDANVPEQREELERLFGEQVRVTLAELFDDFAVEAHDLLDLLYHDLHAKRHEQPVANELKWRIFNLRTFLVRDVFSFLQFFSIDLADEHPNNFYMEREWRILGDLDFKIDDVRRVILPEEYRHRLRVDLPAYTGQVTFV
jgi:hypothetical protein